MTRPSLHPDGFLLEAFDRHWWCPVAQTLFAVTDLGSLGAIVGADAEDPEVRRLYHLDEAELTALTARFGVAVDPALIGSSNVVIRLRRWHRIFEAPYLIHTGYELPLLLDGRKKLATMSWEYPPMTFDGEHRFDHWVAEGVLHREEVIEPFDRPFKEYLGMRTVYYTPKGEEWRIPAWKLMRETASQADTWNETFERLEGMLFGYEPWQNDWWIEHTKRLRKPG